MCIRPQFDRSVYIELVDGKSNCIGKTGEEFQDGVQHVYILGEDEGLVIRGIEASRAQYTVWLVCVGGAMAVVCLVCGCCMTVVS